MVIRATPARRSRLTLRRLPKIREQLRLVAGHDAQDQHSERQEEGQHEAQDRVKRQAGSAFQPMQGYADPDGHDRGVCDGAPKVSRSRSARPPPRSSPRSRARATIASGIGSLLLAVMASHVRRCTTSGAGKKQNPKLLRSSSLNAGADDQRLRAFQQAFADQVELPTGASIIDEPVTVVEVAYDGNSRRGLTA
jgi:hypothetical protein